MIIRVCGVTGRDGADGPEAGADVVGPLARAGRDERQARRQQVADLDVGGGVRAVVGQRDGEGDRVAHVGRCGLLTVLVERQVGLLRRLGGAGGVVAGLGSNWSASVIVAVLVCGSGLTTVRHGSPASAASRRSTVPTVQSAGGRVVAPLAGRGRHERPGPRASRSGHLDAGGRVRAVVGQGDGEGDRVADVGRRVADGLGQRQVGLLGRPVALALLLAGWGRTGRRVRSSPCSCRAGWRPSPGWSASAAVARLTVPTVQTPVPVS